MIKHAMRASESRFHTKCVLYTQRTERGRRHNIWTETQDLQKVVTTTIESKGSWRGGDIGQAGKAKRQKLQNQLCLFKRIKKRGSLTRRNENTEREAVGKYTGKAAYFRSHTTVHQNAEIQGSCGRICHVSRGRYRLEETNKRGSRSPPCVMTVLRNRLRPLLSTLL